MAKDYIMDTLLNILAILLTTIVAASTYNANPVFGKKKLRAEKINIYKEFCRVSQKKETTNEDMILIESLFQLATGFSPLYSKISLVLRSSCRLYAIDNYKRVRDLFSTNAEGVVILNIKSIHNLFSELVMYFLFYIISSHLCIISLVGMINLDYYYMILNKYLDLSISYYGFDYYLSTILALIFIYSLIQLLHKARAAQFLKSIPIDNGGTYTIALLLNKNTLKSTFKTGIRMLPRRILSKTTFYSFMRIATALSLLSLISLKLLD